MAGFDIEGSPWKRCSFMRFINGTYFVNFIFQRVFRINSSAPFLIHFTSVVFNGENIRFSGKTWKYLARANGGYYHGLNGITLGRDTILSTGVKLISTSHDKHDYDMLLVGHEYEIITGKNCWLGANSVLLPGVKLGDNVIVGAGAVVTKSFPSNSILAGVPAICIGQVEGGENS